MDLNMMLRQQAAAGLHTQLDAAVTNGDTEAARKITKDIADLALATAPKQTGFGDAEIKAQLDTKAPWFGVDPKKSAKAVEFGKTMDPKKFPTAEAFADAVIKAVDEEFKPAAAAGAAADDEGGDDSDEDAGASKEQPEKKTRRTDGPGEGDAGVRAGQRRSSGPWTKLTDAPKEVQAEIKRQADKFAPKTEEGRKTFITRSLEANYRMSQQKQGAKS